MRPEESIRQACDLLALAARELLYDILAAEFPTRVPGILGDRLRRIMDAVESKLRTSDVATLQLICWFLKRLTTHLRYLEAASSRRIPPALIPPLERLMKRLVPDSEVLMRMQWSYNYTIFEILRPYREALEQLLEPDEISAIFEKSPTHLYVVSFPAAEHLNILLHTILAHEAGHRIAERFLAAEDPRAVLASIESRVSDAIWFDSQINTYVPDDALAIKQRIYAQILRVRRRGLEELISDFVGYYLFGPAFLFSVQQLALHDSLDALPEFPDYYPPWRFRLREIYSLVEGDGILGLVQALGGDEPIPTVRDSVLESLTDIRATIGATVDKDAIQTQGLLRRAYEEIDVVLPQLPTYVETQLNTLVYAPIKVMNELPDLVVRLSLGIPPNETQAGITDLRSGINAGWFYRLAGIPLPFSTDREWSVEDDVRLNRLVIKAVQYIDLREAYDRWTVPGGA